MRVREYGCKPEESDGCDVGGHYRLVEAPSIPAKLQKRLKRCSGCHSNFYNGRANVTGNMCFSLATDENFRRRGTPKCFHQ